MDDEGAQLVAPGFHVVYLPFLDDFRGPSLPSFPTASEAQVEAAKRAVEKLLIPYDPESVANPRLLRHYAELEALALERPAAQETPDHTCAFTACNSVNCFMHFGL